MLILAALPALTAIPARAEVHEVRMFNRSERGAMLYEPDFLRIAPGDTLRFLPAQPSHNVATIDGMIPPGAAPFKSKINEDFTVTLTEPGRYGLKCSPHFAMGMVMLVVVGEGAPADVTTQLPSTLPPRAAERFQSILAAHPQ